MTSRLKKTATWLLDTCLRDNARFPKLLNHALMSLNRTSPSSFYTYHQRPKRAADVHLDHAGQAVPALPPTAIVIQGPLAHHDDFTLESARLYRRLMPHALIVVSTWRKEPSAALERLRAEGVDVVLSNPPATSGGNNVNFQMVSTLAGIRHAQQAGCEYVLKTRSDQRFHAQNLLPYFFALLAEYPTAYPDRQRRRIIEPSLSICRYRPYSMCDMFQFGHIDDMLTMWNQPLDPRSFSAAEYGRQQITPRKISEDRIAEIYIHRGYLEAIGEHPDVDLATYYRLLADYFIVIDKDVLDLFWNKYHAREHGLADNPLYDARRAKARFHSRDWHMVRQFGVAALDIDPALMDVIED